MAKHGNFTKAADKLCVTQSAVSQAIMQLEDRLGCKLFDRNTRGVQLTTEGEVLYAYADNAVSLIKNAQDKIANMKNLRDGEIKIGASDTACSLFLLPFLDKFNSTHPEIRISVVNRTSRELVKVLKNGAIEIAFINLPVEDETMLEITPVMQIQDCFVAGAKYAYLADSVMRLRDLQKYPILMLEQNSTSRKQMDMFLSGNDIEIKPAIELESLTLLSEFAKIGLGIAATIKEDVQSMLDRRELYELRFLETLSKRNIGLVQLKNVSLSFASEAFKKSITEVIGKDYIS
ncbi:MAG: LysR family transcriptional regulator [Spirochaetes bacterium]|nr:LysR family transcriptional regulator [Spirochaetota bacterium]